MASGQQQQGEELPTARVKLTCWNRDVYEPSDDTFLLVDALQSQAHQWAAKDRCSKPCTIVELGCGSGFVICSIALMVQKLGMQAQLYGLDHSEKALEATQQTLSNHQVTNVQLVHSDMLSGLDSSLQGSIDILVFNPPYVPTPDEEVHKGGVASAWAGGHRGRRVIDRLLPLLPHMLSPSGQLYMVTVTENDPEGIVKEMEPHGFTGRIILSRQADEESLHILHLARC